MATRCLYSLYSGYFEDEIRSVMMVDVMKTNERRIDGLRIRSISTRLCARWEFVRSGKRDMKSQMDSVQTKW